MIKEELVEITVTSNIKDYYIGLGYEVPDKMRTKMLVKSTDLPPSSGMTITRICDDCGEEHSMKRSKYTPICRKCNAPKLSKARKDPSKTTCPKCGGSKSYAAKVCQSCLDMSGENNPMFGKPNPSLTKRNAEVAKDPTKHPNWKGGAGGRTGKQIGWAKAVKEAANNICDCCGYSRGFALEAHHFQLSEGKFWSKQSDYELENGVSLCSNCHKEFHKTYGYGDNTKKQYLEFKEGYHNG
jgi:hypothetical protein